MGTLAIKNHLQAQSCSSSDSRWCHFLLRETSLNQIPAGERMGAEEYVSTLEEGIVPDTQEIAGNELWVLAHDGAPAHRAKKRPNGSRIAVFQLFQAGHPIARI